MARQARDTHEIEELVLDAGGIDDGRFGAHRSSMAQGGTRTRRVRPAAPARARGPAGSRPARTYSGAGPGVDAAAVGATFTLAPTGAGDPPITSRAWTMA